MVGHIRSTLTTFKEGVLNLVIVRAVKYETTTLFLGPLMLSITADMDLGECLGITALRTFDHCIYL